MESIEVVLPEGRKLESTDALQKFDEHLNVNTRKRMVRILQSIEGGSNLPKICRAIMRSLLTNKVMSMYSVVGQKGKLPFKNLEIAKIIMRTIKKSTLDKFKENEIFYEIGEVLSNAPNQPGGINYERRHRARRERSGTQHPRMDEEEESDH
ncbi:hypothetical protein HHUSO_G7786 [Huso huso]|uniref:DUF4806 domain-containing protein n=1 Tax=Huso huso TaxID=61971 RepID=A0ABR0ZVY5_HUSHU